MEELRIPKRRVPVEVSIPGSGWRKVVVFLSEFASNHLGAERVSDLFNGPGEFIPAYDPDKNEAVLLRRDGVLGVRVAADLEPPSEATHTVPDEHELQIFLDDGSALRGLVTYVLPPDRARVIDFLNEAPRFFRIQEQDRVALVNKLHVTHVIPLNE
jgi:hypothetical protein